MDNAPQEYRSDTMVFGKDKMCAREKSTTSTNGSTAIPASPPLTDAQSAPDPYPHEIPTGERPAPHAYPPQYRVV